MAKMIETRTGSDTAMALMSCWLVGSGFAWFRFGTAFTLHFESTHPKQYNGHTLPREMELHLLGDWEISTGSANNSPTSDEPGQAFELAKLRWSEGATVEQVSLQTSTVRIKFRNNVELAIPTKCDDEYAFWLYDPNEEESGSTWSVMYSDEFCYRCPHDSDLQSTTT